MTYYFTPETQLRTDNKQAIFTIEEDGSIVFTEKFDTVVVILDADYQNKTSTPIATLSLSSKLQKNHAVEHTLIASIKYKRTMVQRKISLKSHVENLPNSFRGTKIG